jgi:hypothetical protein
MIPRMYNYDFELKYIFDIIIIFIYYVCILIICIYIVYKNLLFNFGKTLTLFIIKYLILFFAYLLL